MKELAPNNTPAQMSLQLAEDARKRNQALSFENLPSKSALEGARKRALQAAKLPDDIVQSLTEHKEFVQHFLVHPDLELLLVAPGQIEYMKAHISNKHGYINVDSTFGWCTDEDYSMKDTFLSSAPAEENHGQSLVTCCHFRGFRASH
eukprot:TRINITY_DN6561_c0_g1_i2.p1 TRINITY_DN6561_c0_g1~~TRINITY_DN6561_c0_g1_i2.p1  ORF type:complete len:148 (+),score=11.23 TRINITY_DN6561_c0_g1_i2:1-444(+)